VFESLYNFIACIIYLHYKDQKRQFYNKEIEKEDINFEESLFGMDIEEDYFKKKIAEYKIIDRCRCNSVHDYVCSSVYLSHTKESDIFRDDMFMITSNLGHFIFHIDSKGNLSECELLFSDSYTPDFFKELVINMPAGNETDKEALQVIKSRKLFNTNELCSLFKKEQLRIIEME